MDETGSEKEESIREDVFTVHYQHSTPAKCRVALTSSQLILDIHEDDDSECDIEQERYKVEEIFGIHVVQKENEEASIPTVYVCIIFYTSSGSNPARTRVPRIFEVNEPHASFEENLDFARNWVLEVTNALCKKFPNLYSHELQSSQGKIGSSCGEKIDKAFEYLKLAKNDVAKDDAANGKSFSNSLAKTEPFKLAFYEKEFTLHKTLLNERNYLVIINPVSGQAKGLTLFQDRIRPVFVEAGIKIHLVTTEFSGHAHNTVKKYDLSRVDGIVSIGGDGLLNEIVNGIRNRVDSDKFLDIPIGIVATGSGNGLARSTAAFSGACKEYLANPVLYSALCVARGCVSPVNLTEVSLDKRKFYSFLSVGWGLLSDIDIESEVLRYIGEIRFFIWSFIKLFQLRRYKAELSYVPLDAKGSVSSRVIVNDDFVSVYTACQSWIGSDMLFAPDAQTFDSTIHLSYLPSITGRLAAAKYLAELMRGQGKQIDVSPSKYVKVKEFTIRCEGGIEGCLTVDGEQVKGEEIIVKMCDKPLFMLSMGRSEGS